MTHWLIFIGLTGGIIFILVSFLSHASSSRQSSKRWSTNALRQASFKQQLVELEQDLKNNAISDENAQSARNEIARRLIADQQNLEAPLKTKRRIVPILCAILMPLLALGLYLQLGSPYRADVPLGTRLKMAIENQDMPAMIVRLEQHLAQKPDDLKGWTLLASIYRNQERWADLVSAQAAKLRLSKPDATIFADYGEALVFADKGMVSPGAKAAFIEALKLDSKNPKARFFQEYALKRHKVGQAPDLTSDQLQDTQTLTPQQRRTMISNMVEGLEQRLAKNGGTIEDWLRLIRSRIMMGETERANESFKRARFQFKDQQDALTQLDGLATELRHEINPPP